MKAKLNLIIKEQAVPSFLNQIIVIHSRQFFPTKVWTIRQQKWSFWKKEPASVQVLTHLSSLAVKAWYPKPRALNKRKLSKRQPKKVPIQLSNQWGSPLMVRLGLNLKKTHRSQSLQVLAKNWTLFFRRTSRTGQSRVTSTQYKTI
jgi:ABC-type anion transport system duplicated permease subunit